MNDSEIAHRRPGFIPLVAVGLAAGVLSGLFGIGGGTIIVPALALWLGMDQRHAAGTSVFAILPTATVGAISYAVQGNVDWVAALCLAIGIVIGAQVGSALLARFRNAALQWIFMGFLLVVIVSLWFVVPQRSAEIDINALTISMLVLTGFITGIASGLIGVGGGVIVVPVLMFFFSANDLVAKGSSLVMMIPGSISGTLANLRRGNVDMRAGLIVGISASVCVPFSSMLAGLLDPLTANILFSLYLLFILSQMLIRRLKRRKQS